MMVLENTFHNNNKLNFLEDNPALKQNRLYKQNPNRVGIVLRISRKQLLIQNPILDSQNIISGSGMAKANTLVGTQI